MQRRRGTKLTVTSIASLLILNALSAPSSALVLLSDESNREPTVLLHFTGTDDLVTCASTPCSVVRGAPRLVSREDIEQERVKVVVDVDTDTISGFEADPSTQFTQEIVLSFYDSAGTQVLALPLKSPVLLRCQFDFVKENITRVAFSLSFRASESLFDESGAMIGFLSCAFGPVTFSSNNLPENVILTAAAGGSFRLDAMSIPTKPAIAVTLAGAGSQIILDRVGDAEEEVSAGGTLDVPPISVELVRELDELVEGNRRNRIAELDADTRRAVAFTHAFDLPRDARIQGAFLHLGVTSDDPVFGHGVVLFPTASCREASGQRGVPAISLREVPTDSVRNVLVIRFDDDHIVCGSRGETLPDATTGRSVIQDLLDGRLNVVITGGNTVDFSYLTISLRDR